MVYVSFLLPLFSNQGVGVSNSSSSGRGESGGGGRGGGGSVAVLYRVQKSRVTHVWVGGDPEGVATAKAKGATGAGGGQSGCNQLQDESITHSRLFVGAVLEVCVK
jgi:hypothetical protein